MSEEVVDLVREAVAKIDVQVALLQECRERLVGVVAALRAGAPPSEAGVFAVGDVAIVPPVVETLTEPVPHLPVPALNPFAGLTKSELAVPAAPKPARRPHRRTTPVVVPEPKAAGKRGGARTPAKAVDMAEVAREIDALRAAGLPVAAGLATKFGVPTTTTANWISKCRALGLTSKPPDPPVVVLEDHTGPEGDAVPFTPVAVANAYRDALRAGRRPLAAIMDLFNVDRAGAQGYVDRARAHGALPAAGEPQLPDEERRALLEAYKPEPAA